MKASISRRTVTVTLEMTEQELDLLFNGIGITSHNDRLSIGMTVDQSNAIGLLYTALDDAKDNLE